MNTKENYFFISYNRKNLAIKEDLAVFDKRHINYWIDYEEISATDNTWRERAREAVFNDKCCGAVVYLCENALQSNPVEFELELIKQRKSETPEFFVFAIPIGGRSIQKLIKAVLNSVDDSKLRSAIPLTRIAKIAEMFPDEKLLVIRDTDAMEKYYSNIEKTVRPYGVVLDKETLADTLHAEKKLDSYDRYEFGRFYDRDQVVNIVLSSKNKMEEVGGAYYVALDDGKPRLVSSIKWIMLDYSNGKMLLITEKALDSVLGKDIDSWLNGYFYELAFFEEEKKQLVGRVRTLTYEEYVKFSAAMDINPTNGKFWLDSINERKQQNMLMCVNGSRIDKIGKRKDMTYGIRPVIEIKISIGGQHGQTENTQ